MTPLVMHPHEVRAALAGRLGAIVRPLRRQPGTGAHFIRICGRGDAAVFGGPEQHSPVVHIPLPIPEGPFWGRETWAPYEECVDGEWRSSAVFKADDPKAAPRWKTPMCMPRAYSRITGTVTGSRVCRVWEVTPEESYQCGIQTVVLSEVLTTLKLTSGNTWVQVARIERSE